MFWGRASRFCLSLNLASSHEICNFRHEAFEENGDEVRRLGKDTRVAVIVIGSASSPLSHRVDRRAPVVGKGAPGVLEALQLIEGSPSSSRPRPGRAKALDRATFSLLNERHFERRRSRAPTESCKCFLRCSLGTDARCVRAGRALASLGSAIFLHDAEPLVTTSALSQLAYAPLRGKT